MLDCVVTGLLTAWELPRTIERLYCYNVGTTTKEEGQSEMSELKFVSHDANHDTFPSVPSVSYNRTW
jgi:predicted lipase